VHARAGVEQHVAGRQLDRAAAEGVLDDQLAAVVLARIGEEQGAADVGPDPLAAARDEPDSVVDVVAERVRAAPRSG
jgi:hypothetical protein